MKMYKKTTDEDGNDKIISCNCDTAQRTNMTDAGWSQDPECQEASSDDSGEAAAEKKLTAKEKIAKEKADKKAAKENK